MYLDIGIKFTDSFQYNCIFQHLTHSVSHIFLKNANVIKNNGKNNSSLPFLIIFSNVRVINRNYSQFMNLFLTLRTNCICQSINNPWINCMVSCSLSLTSNFLLEKLPSTFLRNIWFRVCSDTFSLCKQTCPCCKSTFNVINIR